MDLISLASNDDHKGRGAFFTPSRLAQFMANWAIASNTDSVLDPGCGEGAFLVPAAKRLNDLGTPPSRLLQLVSGFDIHAKSLDRARESLRAAGLEADLHQRDFFTYLGSRKYQAVVGNPPYVRYQSFSGSVRRRSQELALRHGVRLSGLASSWAAFTVHAADCLTPEGRLALVLPAELLSVNYAAPIRSFLLRRFSKLRLILFEELVFPGVLEDVVVLLGEGAGGADHFEVTQVQDANGLESLDSSSWIQVSDRGESKWNGALTSAALISTYASIVERPEVEPLAKWGAPFLGAVTGANEYFAMNRSQATERKLRLRRDLVSISPPGSRHLKGLTFTKRAWEQLTSTSPGLLFRPASDSPSEPAKKYIRQGEQEQVHFAYKCAARSPWYRTPLTELPDLLLTYMDHERPRLITNEAAVYPLNSLYGMVLGPGRRSIGRRFLPIAAINSLTLLGAELLGRAYGGGLLKLEPKEAARLPMPSVELLKQISDELTKIRPTVGALLRKNDIEGITRIVDEILLRRGLGLSEDVVEQLRTTRAALRARRITRGKSARAR